MFWIIAAVVVVAGFALAWWTSGNSGVLPRRNAGAERDRDEAKDNAHLNQIRGNDVGGPGIGGSF